MMMLALATMPPLFAVPGFLDGWPGWILAPLVAVAPTLALAVRSHRILGHWQRYFAQWRRLAWWAVTAGSLSLALGVFVPLAALPAWDARWADWLRQTPLANPTTLAALTQTRGEEVLIISLATGALLLAGLALLIAGVFVFLRRVLVRRQAVLPSSRWLLAEGSRR